MIIEVPTSADEIVRSKFARTLAKVDGYLTEARGDCKINQTLISNLNPG